MKIINEESFIQNYFNKKRYFVYNEMDPLTTGLILLGAMGGGIIVGFMMAKIKQLEENSLEKYIEDDENYGGLARKKNSSDKGSKFEILENFDEIDDEIAKIGKKSNPEFESKNKDKIKQILELKNKLNEDLKKLDEALKAEELKATPEEKTKLVNTLSEISAKQIELFEDIIKNLDPKNPETPQKIQIIFKSLLRQSKVLGIDSNLLKTELEKLIKNAKIENFNNDEAIKALNQEIPKEAPAESSKTKYTFEASKTGGPQSLNLILLETGEITVTKASDNEFILNFIFNTIEELKSKFKFFKILLNSKGFVLTKKKDPANEVGIFEKNNYLFLEENEKINFSLNFNFKKLENTNSSQCNITPRSVQNFFIFLEKNKIEKEFEEANSGSTASEVTKESKKYTIDLKTFNSEHTRNDFPLIDWKEGSFFTVKKEGENITLDFNWAEKKYSRKQIENFQNFLTKDFYFTKIGEDGKKEDHFTAFENFIIKTIFTEAEEEIVPDNIILKFKLTDNGKYKTTEPNSVKFVKETPTTPGDTNSEKPGESPSNNSSAGDTLSQANDKTNTSDNASGGGSANSSKKVEWPQELYFLIKDQSFIIRKSELQAEKPAETANYLIFTFKNKEKVAAIYTQTQINSSQAIQKGLLETILEKVYTAASPGEIKVTYFNGKYIVASINTHSKYATKDTSGIFVDAKKASKGQPLFKIMVNNQEKKVITTKEEDKDYWFYIQAYVTNSQQKQLYGLNLSKIDLEKAKTFISFLKTIVDAINKNEIKAQINITQNHYIKVGGLSPQVQDRYLANMTNLIKNLKAIFPETDGEGVKFSKIKNTPKTQVTDVKFKNIGFIKTGSLYSSEIPIWTTPPPKENPATEEKK